MFGLSSITGKAIAGLIIGVALITVITLSYKHYTGLVDSKVKQAAEIATLHEDVTREKARVEALGKVIDRWDVAAQEQAKSLDKFSAAQREAGAYVKELTNVISKHDLGALAKRKPGLIENHVNAGSADAMRLLERATEGPAVTTSQGASADNPAIAAPSKD